MKTYTISALAILLFIMPFLASAQLTGTSDLITAAGGIVRQLTVLAGAIALFAFLWGLAVFVFRIGGDEKAVDNGKVLMKWGLIALFVMVSVWGIIGFFQHELGLPQTVGGSQRVEMPDEEMPLFDSPQLYD